MQLIYYKSIMKNNIVYYRIVNKNELDSNSETINSRKVLKDCLKYLNKNLPEIEISKYGKPYFKNSNIQFNYSHTKNYIACAISYDTVGIDIEETTRIINDKVSKKYLENAKNNTQRIEKWVRKEAYSKMKGLGLKMPLQDIKLNKIKSKNILLKNKDYICSIYCENDNTTFKKIIKA